jgi:hypothetical protein
LGQSCGSKPSEERLGLFGKPRFGIKERNEVNPFVEAGAASGAIFFRPTERQNPFLAERFVVESFKAANVAVSGDAADYKRSIPKESRHKRNRNDTKELLRCSLPNKRQTVEVEERVTGQDK